MIELLDVSYVRLGTRNLDQAQDFATRILGLQVSDRAAKTLHLRSDARVHTLCYFEGDPADQTVAFEVRDAAMLEAAAATLEKLGHPVRSGTRDECSQRQVQAFIAFKDPNGNQCELVTRPCISGKRFYGARDAAITGFNHVGMFTSDPKREEMFWTQVFDAKVSDRIGDIALLRVNKIHHTMALAPGARAGLHHINHQVESTDDVMRSWYFLQEQGVPIVFGPGRHPTSGSRFLYFLSPDGMMFEYSVGVDEIQDEANHRPRQFPMEATSLCMWGSKPVFPTQHPAAASVSVPAGS
jgi:2,3-dihydroxy-p-cumate/2,3-dihydroxybenzoate 3,4-dioxygenase